MSELLDRQLKRLGLCEDRPPDATQWRAFLAQLRRTYSEADQDRYTFERSVMISSREMRALYEQSRENEQRFRRLFDSDLLGVCVAEPDGRIVEANDAFLLTLGRTRESFATGALFWKDVMPGESRPPHSMLFAEAGGPAATKPWEAEYLRADGSRVAVLAGAAKLEGGRTISFSFDLSDLKRAEARKAAIVDRALDAIVGIDHLGRITEFNPAAEEIFQHSRAEILGRPILQTLIPPALRETQLEALAAYLTSRHQHSGATRLETSGLRSDGSEVPIEVSVTRLGLDDPPSFMAFIRDISARKKAEEASAALEQQLRQSQKMEAVGRFAGGVAHDFNNMLTVILSYSTLLEDELAVDDPFRHEVREIHTAGVRAMELTRSLLAFSRQQVLQPAVVDLNQCVAAMERMLRRIVPENIHLSVTLAPFPVRSLVDPGQIEQVLMNLVVNARDAMPGGGDLKLSLEAMSLDQAYCAEHVDASPSPHVLLTVSDTGVGMDASTQARIFDPFFTTKEKGKGTGLGLSTVFGIVKQSRGHISVESELGKGTTFRVFLPAAAGEPRRQSSQRLAIRESGVVRETILLVEDDAQVRGVARNILRRGGYVVIEASSAAQALSLSESHEGKIHLLLTDVVMPRMNGPALASQITSIRPDTRVLFMSGYADDDAFLPRVSGKQLVFVQKPLTPAVLLRDVEAVLR